MQRHSPQQQQLQQSQLQQQIHQHHSPQQLQQLPPPQQHTQQQQLQSPQQHAQQLQQLQPPQQHAQQLQQRGQRLQDHLQQLPPQSRLQDQLQQQQHQQRLQQQMSRLGTKRNYNSMSESEVMLTVNNKDLDLSLKSSSAEDGQFKKARAIRDAQAHRLIEKRRRDRMNNCLSDLDKLIQASYPEHRQGRVEKTEIIEMAIHHINLLQQHLTAQRRETREQFISGFKSCRDEVAGFLLVKADEPDSDSLSLISHLQNKLEKLQSDNQQSTGSSVGAILSSSPSNLYRNHFPQMRGVPPPLPLDVKQEASTPPDPSPRQYPDLENLCKQELVILNPDNPDKLSPASSLTSSESVEFSKPNNSTEWLTADDPGLDSIDLRRRRRSFSECSGVASNSYKFKNNMKVRFKEDNKDGPALIPERERNGIIPPNGLISDSNNNNNSNTSVMPHRGSYYENNEESNNNSNNSLNNSNISKSGVESLLKSCGKSVISSLMHNAVTRLEEIETSEDLIELNHHPRRSSLNQVNGSCDLPGFVLYPGHSFYIPVRVSSGFLAPFLRNFSVDSACHPVSISVNFSGPCIREVGARC